MRRVGFLHTSPVHTETFERLIHELDESVLVATVVDEALLEDARSAGLGSELVSRAINAALDTLLEAGSNIIVCTCSTIAGQAEIEGLHRSVDVVRVDRPMAEVAVSIGTRVTVIAALQSTVGPTTDLICEVALQHEHDVAVQVRVCSDAWPYFERGDMEGYLARVAAACEEVSESSDVIVLAQASMAQAAHLCDVDIPVLSSPVHAVKAAVAALHDH